MLLILGLYLYSKDPGSVGDAINVFLSPDLSTSVGLEAGLLARRQDAIMDGGALISFAGTSLLLANQRVEPVMNWEAVDKQLEAWGLFCHILLGDAAVHLATYEVCSLVE